MSNHARCWQNHAPARVVAAGKEAFRHMFDSFVRCAARLAHLPIVRLSQSCFVAKQMVDQDILVNQDITCLPFLQDRL